MPILKLSDNIDNVSFTSYENENNRIRRNATEILGSFLSYQDPSSNIYVGLSIAMDLNDIPNFLAFNNIGQIINGQIIGSLSSISVYFSLYLQEGQYFIGRSINEIEVFKRKEKLTKIKEKLKC